MQYSKLFFCVCWIFLVACNQATKKRTDFTGNVRIVSVSKQITEMLYALGKGDQIIACDLTSSYPANTKQLPKVGYHRMLSVEGIISMKPDIVVHSNDIGPATVIPQLENAGVSLKAFGGASSPDSAKILLQDLGNFFGVADRARSIINAIDTALANVAMERNQYTDTPSVMIIHYGQANNVFFVMSGRKGAGDKMIELAGGKIAAYDAKGARQLSAEAIAAANPDIIIATDYGFDQLGGIAQFKTLPGVALTKAAKTNKIYRFEEHDLVYFGPRSGQNIRKLMQLIHR